MGSSTNEFDRLAAELRPLSIAEAAKLLGCSHKTAMVLIKTGVLQGYKQGSRYKTRLKDIRQYQEEQQRQAAERLQRKKPATNRYQPSVSAAGWIKRLAQSSGS